MAFNFESAFKHAEKQLNNNALFAILLGASGGGKSSAIGTLPGKTLFIYGSGESHGPKAAKALGGQVTPICMDLGDDGQPLSPDDAYGRLLNMLQDVAGIKAAKFNNVAVDGAPEIEAILLKSKRFESAITNDKGKINSFAKSEAMSCLIRDVTMALKKLHAEGINIVLTCRADVRALGDDGQVEDCSPKLTSYGVAESLVAAFDEVLLVGPVMSGNKQGYAFQFGATVSKVSKDATGVVKKILNFNPRVTGVSDIPALLKADLAQVIALKQGKK